MHFLFKSKLLYTHRGGKISKNLKNLKFLQEVSPKRFPKFNCAFICAENLWVSFLFPSILLNDWFWCINWQLLLSDEKLHTVIYSCGAEHTKINSDCTGSIECQITSALLTKQNCFVLVCDHHRFIDWIVFFFKIRLKIKDWEGITLWSIDWLYICN